MNHPHKIEYYQAFPSVMKPVYNPCDNPAPAPIQEEQPRDLDWWQDSDDENA